MFRTHTTDLVGIPGAFGEGLAYWQSVSRILRTHWYHVTLRVEEEGRSTEAVVMIDGEIKLQRLLMSQQDGISVSDLQVVTPSWMNKTSSWQMGKVEKVILGEDIDGCSICSVEMEDGEVFHSTHRSDFDARTLRNLRPIFFASMLRAA